MLSRGFHQIQEYLKKKFEMIVNLLYGNHIAFNLFRCEYMSFGKLVETKYLHTMKSNLKNCY